MYCATIEGINPKTNTEQQMINAKELLKYRRFININTSSKHHFVHGLIPN
jgi:hypothetical protein